LSSLSEHGLPKINTEVIGREEIYEGKARKKIKLKKEDRIWPQ
jgi:hypothetical protein